MHQNFRTRLSSFSRSAYTEIMPSREKTLMDAPSPLRLPPSPKLGLENVQVHMDANVHESRDSRDAAVESASAVSSWEVLSLITDAVVSPPLRSDEM